MSISIRGNLLLSRLQALVSLQRFDLSFDRIGHQVQSSADISTDSSPEPGEVPFSKWRKLDSRTFGITRSMISEPSWIVLKILQTEGFEAYLVGGCVRDLILNKVPKDFDVITTATLRKIRGLFHNASIVGRRFPICMVRVKGSEVEVSSFETVAKHSEAKEKFLVSQTPRNCNKLDVLRWRNSMQRDFTINSLFFNPFANTIYDYANGMNDLRSLKLRTVMPAHQSMKEDCARILRGLRIAARLGLSFSRETETAINKLSSSIKSLSESRIMLELNYMLSYGTAEPSFRLLRRFKLLDVFFPFYAEYFAQQTHKSGESSMMLMKLLFHLDQLIACDRPSNCSLWVGLLAFHLALVNNPQHPTVVLAFASVLYHRRWKDALQFSRMHYQIPNKFTPEILETNEFIPDDELADRVRHLALLAKKTVGAFSGCSSLVFISKKIKSDVSQIFDFLDDVESHTKRRLSHEIDYKLLTKGNEYETGFVLGKIILQTIHCGSPVERHDIIKGNDDDTCMIYHQGNSFPPNDLARVDKKSTLDSSDLELNQEITKKQKPLHKYNCLLDQDFGEKKKVKYVPNTENKCVVQKDSGKIDENLSIPENNELPNSHAHEVGELKKKHKQDMKNKERGYLPHKAGELKRKHNQDKKERGSQPSSHLK